MIRPFDLHPMTEGQREYREGFLSSPEWIRIRPRVIARDGGKCRICGAHDGLEVHHFSYDEDRMLDPDNLVTVCRRCHEVLTAAVKKARVIKYDLGESSPKWSSDTMASVISNRIAAQNGQFVARVLFGLYRASLQNGGSPINILDLETLRPIHEIVTKTLDGQITTCISFSEGSYVMRLHELVNDYRARAYLHYASQGFSVEEIQRFLGLNYAQMAKVRKNAARVVDSSG